MKSLETLDCEYLDLYLIHWPGVQKLKSEDPRNAELRQESWKALEKLCKAGEQFWFKYIGEFDLKKDLQYDIINFHKIIIKYWYYRGHGFESRSGLKFFQALISQLFKFCA